MLIAILHSAIGGIFGTGLGGILGLFFVRRRQSLFSPLLAFAAGVMVGISCFDLIPEALNLVDIWDTVLGVAIGCLLVAGLDGLMSLVYRPSVNQKAVSGQGLTRSGYLMLLAIGLHNFPEGLAIGASGGHDLTLGLTVAILIAIHDVPEGMSIVLPLCAGGMRKGKAVLLAAISGLPTLLGGFVGAWLSLNDALIGISLAAAAGAMLYVTFLEMIPQILAMKRTRGTLPMILAGILTGLIAVEVIVQHHH